MKLPLAANNTGAGASARKTNNQIRSLSQLTNDPKLVISGLCTFYYTPPRCNSLFLHYFYSLTLGLL